MLILYIHIVQNINDSLHVTKYPLSTFGENLQLNCMVNISMTHMNTTQLNLILYHNDTGSVIARENITAFKSFTFGTSINNVASSNAGTYTCIYYLSNSNPFIQDSDNKTAATNITLRSELNDSCIKLLF